MNSIYLKALAAFIILIITVLAGIWPFLRKKNDYVAQTLDFPRGEALASGIFLGAGMLHLLPSASTQFSAQGYQYPLAFLYAMAMFLLLLLLEHTSVSLQKHSQYFKGIMSLLATIMLSIHALFEGMVVGVSTNIAIIMGILVAILAHKGVVSFALAVTLNSSQLNFIKRSSAFAIFALMTPIGIWGGSWLITQITPSSLLTPVLNSLAAGTFLYIGSLHGLGRASLIKYCCNMPEFSIMLLGFTLMAILAIWT